MRSPPSTARRHLGVADEELAQRVDLNADLCAIDGEHFFVRGHIEIPIHGSDEPFAWSVWCRMPGVVPTVEVEPTEHPLAVEQRGGISWRRVEEIAHVVLGHGTRDA